MNRGIKCVVSVIAGSAAAYLGQYGLFAALVAAAVALDVITGIVKAKAMGEGLSSERAARGFWHKMTLFAALAFGIFLDLAGSAVLESAGVSLGSELPFALIICSYIILNEAISIAENLYLANPDSFPRGIAMRLKVARDKLAEDGAHDEEDVSRSDAH